MVAFRRTKTSENIDKINSDGAASDICESPERKSMFADSASMKEKLRESMVQPEYDVADFYWQTGWCQVVARHPKFEQCTLAVIAFNALWISIDTDLNEAEMLLTAHPVFQIAEHFFCAYFTFEWTMRFGAFKKKRNGLRDHWFVFDSMMVFMMVAETWVMSIVLLAMGAGGGGSSMGNASILRLLRLLRLSRMARMAKLLRSMPELLILIKGMVSATRSVFFTLLLLLILIYVFAIALRQLTADTTVGLTYFSSIPKSMHTLLLDGTLMDGPGTLISLMEADGDYVFIIIFYIFVTLSALMVMNMLIGVLCEVVSAVAATEKESITVATVKDGFQRIIDEGGLDTDGDHMISKKEFEAILDSAEATRLLERVQVDVYGLVDLADFIFDKDDDEAEEVQLEFPDFMEIVLSLRGSNTTTVKDMVDMRKFIKGALDQMAMRLVAKQMETRSLSRKSTMSPRSLSRKRPVPDRCEIRARMSELEGILGVAQGEVDSLVASISAAPLTNGYHPAYPPKSHDERDDFLEFHAATQQDDEQGQAQSYTDLKPRMFELRQAMSMGLDDLRCALDWL
mmetsp:Transcript_73278/g.164665  ORF Transcript_73278/g.164665 Transcript_73278/m.164665 type:complete len:570 (+) Transcript_73278:89-1798(+)